MQVSSTGWRLEARAKAAERERASNRDERDGLFLMFLMFAKQSETLAAVREQCEAAGPDIPAESEEAANG